MEHLNASWDFSWQEILSSGFLAEGNPRQQISWNIYIHLGISSQAKSKALDFSPRGIPSSGFLAKRNPKHQEKSQAPHPPNSQFADFPASLYIYIYIYIYIYMLGPFLSCHVIYIFHIMTVIVVVELY